MILSRLLIAVILCAAFAVSFAATPARAQSEAGRVFMKSQTAPYNITRADIATAKMTGSGAFRSALITLTPAATQSFHDFTKDKAGLLVSITIDGTYLTSMIIMEPVDDGILGFAMTPEAEKILGPLMRP